MKADQKQMTRLLKTARGQIDGILKMIEEDRYCLDISHQIMAADAILRRANKEVLKAHLEACILEAVQQGDVDKVKELTGYEMFLFRAPYGDYDNDVIACIKENGYYPIQWDVDSLDWKDYGSQDIIKKITENAKLGNGSIILCHNGAKYITDALDTVLSTLQEKGYEFVPISQLIYKDQYYINHEGRQIPEI